MKPISFDPALCAGCATIDCLMKCQYLAFADIDDARTEKFNINEGRDSRMLHECLTCYACQEYCPYDNNPFYLLVERQEEKGLLPAPRPILEEQLRMMAPKGRIEKKAVSAPVVDMCAFPMLTGCVRGRLFENASTYCWKFLVRCYCNPIERHWHIGRRGRLIAQLRKNYILCIALAKQCRGK